MSFYNPRIHHRRTIRVYERDYSAIGTYFITMCTMERERIFGDIHNDHVILNKFGQCAREFWRAIPEHFPFVNIDTFVIMPDHMHGILKFCGNTDAGRGDTGTVLGDEGTACRAPTTDTHRQFGRGIPRSLSSVIGSYKSAVTKRINDIRNTRGQPIWQRNYHERIIRDDAALQNMRQYIANNPKQWSVEHGP